MIHALPITVVDVVCVGPSALAQLEQNSGVHRVRITPYSCCVANACFLHAITWCIGCFRRTCSSARTELETVSSRRTRHKHATARECCITRELDPDSTSKNSLHVLLGSILQGSAWTRVTWRATPQAMALIMVTKGSESTEVQSKECK